MKRQLVALACLVSAIALAALAAPRVGAQTVTTIKGSNGPMAYVGTNHALNVNVVTGGNTTIGTVDQGNPGTKPWPILVYGTSGRAALVTTNYALLVQNVGGSTAVTGTSHVFVVNFPVVQDVNCVSGCAGSPGSASLSTNYQWSGTAWVRVVGDETNGTKVQVTNFPGTQPVSGTVAVSNFPATQTVAGTVAVSSVAGTVTVAGTVAATQSGTWNVVASGTVTANQGAAAAHASAWPIVVTTAGTASFGGTTNPLQTNVTNFPATQVVSGTVAVSSIAGTVTVAGTVAATQSGTWTVQQGGAPWSVSQSGTWNVGLNAGANTIGKVDQGIGGASAWKVDGSAVTQPVSGTVTANQGTPAANASAWPILLTTGGSAAFGGATNPVNVNCTVGCSGSAGAATSSTNYQWSPASPTSGAWVRETGDETNGMKVQVTNQPVVQKVEITTNGLTPLGGSARNPLVTETVVNGGDVTANAIVVAPGAGSGSTDGPGVDRPTTMEQQGGGLRTSLVGFIDAGNSFTELLGTPSNGVNSPDPSAAFPVGQWTDASGFGAVQVTEQDDASLSSTCTVRVWETSDPTNFPGGGVFPTGTVIASFSAANSTINVASVTVPLTARYYRVGFLTCTSNTGNSYVSLQSILRPAAFPAIGTATTSTIGTTLPVTISANVTPNQPTAGSASQTFTANGQQVSVPLTGSTLSGTYGTQNSLELHTFGISTMTLTPNCSFFGGGSTPSFFIDVVTGKRAATIVNPGSQTDNYVYVCPGASSVNVIVSGYASGTTIAALSRSPVPQLQDASPKDRGRTQVTFTANGVAGVTSEALLSVTKNVDGTATASQTTYTISTGKTLRCQAMMYSNRAATTTISWGHAVLRYAPAGSCATSSTPVYITGAGAPAALAGGRGEGDSHFPDGIEFGPGDGTKQICASHLDQATGNLVDFSLACYEY